MKVTDFEVFVRRLPAWACAAISIVVILPFDALAEENAGAWERGFTVAPYGWLAGFDGTVGVPSQDIDQAGALGLPLRLDVELNGELEEIGFMFYADWRGERWTVFFDSVWVNVTQAADVSIGQLLPDSVVKATIDGNIYTVAGGYRLKDWQASTLTVYAGPRYYDVEATVDAEGGQAGARGWPSTASSTWTARRGLAPFAVSRRRGRFVDEEPPGRRLCQLSNQALLARRRVPAPGGGLRSRRTPFRRRAQRAAGRHVVALLKR